MKQANREMELFTWRQQQTIFYCNWLKRLAKSWKLVKSNFCLFSNPVNSCTEVVIYLYSHLNLRYFCVAGDPLHEKPTMYWVPFNQILIYQWWNSNKFELKGVNAQTSTSWLIECILYGTASEQHNWTRQILN